MVALLHVALLVAMIRARMPVDEPPMLVLVPAGIIDAAPAPEAPPPAPAVQLATVSPQFSLPQVPLPLVEAPASTSSITVAAMSAPVATAAAPAGASGPAGGGPPLLSASEVDYLRPPAPRYPRVARQERMQGTVQLWVLIGEDGKPREVRVHRSSGHALLDQEGRDAVRRALFRPYVYQGRPSQAQVIVPVQFLLNIHAGR